MAFGFFNDVIKYFNGSWAHENELIDHYKNASDNKVQEIIDKYGDNGLSDDLDYLCNLVCTASAICGARLGMKTVLKQIDENENDIES